MMTSLKRGSVTAHSSYLTHRLRVYIESLITVPGSRLFGTLVARALDFIPAAQVQIPPKSWDFFQPNLLCFVLCYCFHVVKL